MTLIRTLFWGSLLAISYLSLAPLSGVSAYVPYQDKVAHASVYCYLYTLGWLAFNTRKFTALSWLNKRLVVWLIIYGMAIEYLQGLTAYRSREFADLLANWLGIAIGLAVVGCCFGFLKNKAQDGANLPSR